MKRALLAAGIAALALLAGAQQAPTPPAPIPRPAQLDQAIEDFARGIPAGITADRYAAFAVQMPADEAEYEALNKQALVLIIAISKQGSELPPKRVYLEQDSGTLKLPLISSFRVALGIVKGPDAGPPPASYRFGRARSWSWYLIPTSAWRKPGTLLLDFAENRKEFVLGKFPQPIEEDFIRNDAKPEPGRGRTVAPEAIQRIMERAMPAKISSAAGASDPGSPAPVWLSEEMANALLVDKVRVRYPEAAKRSQIEGTVVLSVLIGRDGLVKEARVVSGDPLLAQPTMEAVKQSRYRPYLLGGQPVEVETQVTTVFEMR